MGKSQRQRSSTSKKPRPVEELAESDSDEEIPEDEAFNSDDERKYGIFFEKDGRSSKEDKNTSDDDGDDEDGSENESLSDVERSEDDSGESDGVDEDSEEGDEGEYMLDLLEKLDRNGKSRGVDRPSLPSATIAKYTKESEFSASVVPKASLTLDSLMDGLKDTQGFGVVQKQLKKVAQGTPTAAPLARVVSERVRRKVHYENETKDVSQWIAAVQENRQAETLDFRPKERVEITKDIMVDSFVPTTDFEKQIHEALLEAGQQDEEAILKAEQAALDDLGANEITLDEYKKRRGQLAKMRALMFYQERKNHQIKKIKSKTYRRIRKRQRERTKTADLEARAQDDEELVRELEEKEEVERMKERMTLAHKNTSKWAKRVLKRGKNVDLDTRRALSAQLKRGDDLLQRMKTTQAGVDGDDDDSDEDLVDAARKVLAETEEDTKAEEEPKGLFKLAFMQKGIERQRQQAREEARALLRELEEREENVSVDAGMAENDAEDPPKVQEKRKIASKDEMKNVLGSDDLVAAQLKFGNSNKMIVSGDIRVDTGDPSASIEAPTEEAPASANVSSVSVHNSALEPRDRDPDSSVKLESRRKRKKTAAPTAGTEESNPWLQSTGKQGMEKAPKKSRSSVVNLEDAINLVEPASRNSNVVAAKDSTSSVAPAGEKPITSLTQEELVQRAFATISEKEIDEEFAKEKEAVAEEEDVTTKDRDKKPKGNVGVDGWGSWIGAGSLPAKPPRKLPKKLQAPEKKLPPRPRADETKPHVVLSEKRLKKLANNYMVADVPYPFTCREEYERAMAGGVGKEWNVTNSFKDMTRPEILTRAGKIIQPISMKVKQKRPAAKF